MPLGQCRIELRGSTGHGEPYVKVRRAPSPAPPPPTLPSGHRRLRARALGRIRRHHLPPSLPQVSARFSHSIIRLRGSTPLETARWLQALRASAGLAPLGYGGMPSRHGVSPESRIHAAAAAAAATAPTDEPAATAPTGAAATTGGLISGLIGAGPGGAAAADRSDEPPPPSLPPLGILEEFVAAELTMSQRCSYLYLTAQRDFVRPLVEHGPHPV